MLKILQTSFNRMWIVKIQIFKLVLEKAQEAEIKLPISAGSLKKQEFQKNIYFCFIDYAKAFDCVDHNKLWKILKEMGILGQLNCLLRPDMQQWTGPKLGKEYVKAEYCHPIYLVYMQSTSHEMLGWMKHKLESRLPGEISITLDTQMTALLWQKVKQN